MVESAEIMEETEKMVVWEEDAKVEVVMEEEEMVGEEMREEEETVAIDMVVVVEMEELQGKVGEEEETVAMVKEEMVVVVEIAMQEMGEVVAMENHISNRAQNDTQNLGSKYLMFHLLANYFALDQCHKNERDTKKNHRCKFSLDNYNCNYPHIHQFD